MIRPNPVIVPSIGKLSASGETIFVGNFDNATTISVQVDWFGLNALDGSIKLQHRKNSSAEWSDIPKLIQNLDVADGTITLTRYDYISHYIGLFIDKGSCTNGNINIYAEGR